jgi:heme-degrading monooxygenase HmoA
MKGVLEVAILDVKPGQEDAFERDFAVASKYISSVPGYISHDLHRCIEKAGRYLLLAHWTNLEAHTEGFSQSPQYLDWKKLLHHYYDPFPTVEHYRRVLGSDRAAQ